ncbi:glycosyltransferase family 4 protein [Candidatus Gottesmanbacteria bacterium]|nr:glycosyltransferase family 4 protein [Candidatus Gottesmanbacteria bacterium]
MRILLITPYFYPHIGGSQQYAMELYRHLMSLDKKVKVDVICYNSTNSPTEENYKGFSIYRIPCIDLLNGQFAIPNYLELWRIIRKLTRRYKYDIVNSHSRFFENSWWVPLLAKHLDAKSILTDHASSRPVHRSLMITRISRLLERITAPIMKHYDLVTVTNKATSQYLKSLGVEKPKLIYGGVDTDFFKPNSKQKYRSIPNITGKQFKNNDLIITFLGRMITTKGPQLLYEVARKLTKSNKKLNFIFAGSGEMYLKLKRVNTKQIYFTHALNMSQVRQLLAKTDIFVNPSYHFEGFPNVLLEAGASGCAVIATDVGGVTELIINNKTGLIVRPENNSVKKALEALIKNKKKRLFLGKELRKKIEQNFSWKNIAPIYLNVLNKLIHTNKTYTLPSKDSLSIYNQRLSLLD